MNNFKPGDVVRLKSGGPLMTIGRPKLVAMEGRKSPVMVEDPDLHYCHWINKGVPIEAIYHVDELTKTPQARTKKR